MKFAEMTQEVQIARPTITKLDFGLTPGRRQANKVFKEVRSRLEKEGLTEAANLEVDIGLVYSLGGSFPNLEITSPHNDQVIINLMNFLEQRINKRNLLRADLEQKQNDFRKMLLTVEQENINLKIENATLKASSTQQKKKVFALEGHLCKTEAQIDNLLHKLNTANDTIRSLQHELKDRDMVLNQRIIDKQRVKQKYTNKIQHETDKMNRELETKLKAQREHLQNQMKEKEDKLQLVKQILVDENSIIPILKDFNGEETHQTISTKIPTKLEIHSRANKLGVTNPRYRRSQSADRWVDHRPEILIPVGTVLQPLMKRRRSITKLTSPKEIIEGVSRYCLTAQNQDSEGELETKLYKADILPTRGGGAQVVFNDVECLKQLSPTGQRKRSCPKTDKDNNISSDNVNRYTNQEITTLSTKRPRK